jgi:hypothetical protein
LFYLAVFLSIRALQRYASRFFPPIPCWLSVILFGYGRAVPFFIVLGF